MRKEVLIVLALLILAGAAYAQMGGGMMGPGMMGGGYGGGYYGEQGWGCPGPGCGGWGMGQGMMGGGMMGQGMMGWRAYSPQSKKFLDDTRDLRKEILIKQYEYNEVMRDPGATSESVMKLQEELRRLNIKLYEKAPAGFYGW